MEVASLFSHHFSFMGPSNSWLDFDWLSKLNGFELTVANCDAHVELDLHQHGGLQLVDTNEQLLHKSYSGCSPKRHMPAITVASSTQHMLIAVSCHYTS